MNHLYTYFAQTQASLSDLAAREAEKMEARQITQRTGGVEFKGTLETGYRFCLWSRTASRLLLLLNRADSVEESKDIFALSADVPWEEHIHPSSTIAVRCTSRNASWVTNTHATALVAKDAIADRMREITGTRPDVDAKNPDLQIHVHVEGREAYIYLDLSGISLHKRGYHQRSGKASLKEHLAASILIRSGWDQFEGPLLDPFCGSATISIEAALMKLNIAPGLYHQDRFGFLSWMQHDPVLWRNLLKQADDLKRTSAGQLPLIAAWDNDPKALDAARANINEAGLRGRILVQFKDAKRISQRDLEPFEDKRGMIVTDMPYGVRTGTDEDLPELYAQFGKVLTSQFKGWYASILTQDPDLLSSLRLKPSRTNSIMNGPLECILGRYELFEDRDRERMAEKRQAPEELSSGAQMFANRLMKNWKQLRKYLKASGVTSYRIYDADMPEYSAAIDIYEKTWIHLQEYAPPKTVDPEGAERRLQEMIDGVQKVTGIDHRNIFVKTRKRGKHQYEKYSSKASRVIMHEQNLSFYINLSDYLDTGIFLDHRIIRQKIREMSAEKRFLNLYGYTGTATVFAVAGGASRTVTVDISNTYLEWGKDNLELNGYRGRRYEYVKSDVFEYLKSSTDTFDLIFLDPPTFSNSKMVPGTLDTQRDHPALINFCMDRLADDGKLIFSTNYRKFSMDEAITKAFQVEDITKESISPDYRNKRIHSCWIITKKPLVRTVKVKRR